MAKDPVCHMDVDENEAADTSEHTGNSYYFCAPACKKAFDRDPERYILLPVEHLVSMLANRSSFR